MLTLGNAVLFLALDETSSIMLPARNWWPMTAAEGWKEDTHHANAHRHRGPWQRGLGHGHSAVGEDAPGWVRYRSRTPTCGGPSGPTVLPLWPTWLVVPGQL